MTAELNLSHVINFIVEQIIIGFKLLPFNSFMEPIILESLFEMTFWDLYFSDFFESNRLTRVMRGCHWELSVDFIPSRDFVIAFGHAQKRLCVLTIKRYLWLGSEFGNFALQLNNHKHWKNQFWVEHFEMFPSKSFTNLKCLSEVKIDFKILIELSWLFRDLWREKWIAREMTHRLWVARNDREWYKSDACQTNYS